MGGKDEWVYWTDAMVGLGSARSGLLGRTPRQSCALAPGPGGSSITSIFCRSSQQCSRSPYRYDQCVCRLLHTLSQICSFVHARMYAARYTDTKVDRNELLMCELLYCCVRFNKLCCWCCYCCIYRILFGCFRVLTVVISPFFVMSQVY